MTNGSSLLRMVAAMMIALSLVAGSLAAVSAGGGIPEGPPVENGTGDASSGSTGGGGASGGDGGNAGVDGGNNSNSNDIDQVSEQSQNQSQSQVQVVNQTNTSNMDQSNTVNVGAGGSAGGACAVNQNDDAVDVAGNATNGGDAVGCTIGDSSVGDSSVGATNQANVGSQSGTNTASQNQSQVGGNQVNAPVANVDQVAGNVNVATAGDGGEGGDGGDADSAAIILDASDDDSNDNDGDQSEDTSTITTIRVLIDRLTVILNSILGDGNQSDNSVDTGGDDPGNDDFIPFNCTVSSNLGQDVETTICESGDATVSGDCDIGGGNARLIEEGDTFTCLVAGIDYDCVALADASGPQDGTRVTTLECTAEA